MLILTRTVGEAICIEGGIRVVVLQADGKTVRLGIEAPDVTVLREEVVERITGENIRAELPPDARRILEALEGPDDATEGDGE